jgi:hypothetical protein
MDRSFSVAELLSRESFRPSDYFVCCVVFFIVLFSIFVFQHIYLSLRLVAISFRFEYLCIYAFIYL